MAPAHIFPAESIMGIIPASSHTCNSLIRNSGAHTLMEVQHDHQRNLVHAHREKNVGSDNRAGA